MFSGSLLYHLSHKKEKKGIVICGLLLFSKALNHIFEFCPWETRYWPWLIVPSTNFWICSSGKWISYYPYTLFFPWESMGYIACHWNTWWCDFSRYLHAFFRGRIWNWLLRSKGCTDVPTGKGEIRCSRDKCLWYVRTMNQGKLDVVKGEMSWLMFWKLQRWNGLEWVRI